MPRASFTYLNNSKKNKKIKKPASQFFCQTQQQIYVLLYVLIVKNALALSTILYTIINNNNTYCLLEYKKTQHKNKNLVLIFLFLALDDF